MEELAHMIDEPLSVIRDSFQEAWLEVVKLLALSNWERRNLVVQIRNPQLFDYDLHQRFDAFCGQVEMLGPRHVAYTIFPDGFYAKG